MNKRKKKKCMMTDSVNTMNTHKLCPMAIRTIQYCKQNLLTHKSKKLVKIDSQVAFTGVSATFGLAWALWPAKKSEEIVSERKVNVIEDILKKADDLFDNGHYENCYDVLQEANELQEQNMEILWRMARVLYNMSKQPKYDKDEKKKIVSEAFTIISNQLQHGSNHFAVQKWYALLLDAKSSHDGVSERIKQLENVKKHMDLAVTLNPDDATTLFMLGEWCYQITEMPWHHRKIAEVLFATPPTSTYEDALEYFLRAEAAQPRFYSLNLLRLGSCYLKLEKEDQAKYYLKLAASYPAKSNDDHLANKEASELLRRMRRNI